VSLCSWPARFAASVEKTKQFRLQTEPDFANFIEEERNAIG
jgi:hypothetical protein